MDDYACVLGMSFMDRVKAIPIPFANNMCIVEEGGAYTIPLRRGRAGTSTLSALQLAKGVKREELTFLVALQAEEGKHAVEVPKEVQAEQLILKLPDYSSPFEVHADASDFVIGGVLMQGGHPIAYESRKLNETKRRYTMQGKEMTAIIHCLKTWRHYLLGSRFMVKMDNVATSYFLTQKKLSPKQARWQAFLREFDFVMEYKPRKADRVVDAQKPQSRVGGNHYTA
ncbi:hypothetical protein GH714_007925 [Hevea brasiliensis]|uniref:Reverse transcriptase RNase H-like domain-containing protein n=1 Tax=Hevea brasiliensis TaxID=3981 RepID=A0A6A6NC60_HEVBR|nr:hypothetical protein GH714_007925 [Hevea brasiliensis]